MSPRRRILFFSEAVTLAHLVRPLALAQALDPLVYEVHFACAYCYENLFKDLPIVYWPVESISYDAYLNSVSGGKSAYDREQLGSYVAEEDALIREIQPDLIVSDNRMTLSISAPSAGVPLVNLNNAYWSAYQKKIYSPVPSYDRSLLFNILPKALAKRLLPYPVAKTFYAATKTLLQRQFAAPFNRYRRERGLPVIGQFEAFYTYGDWTLYFDVPDMLDLHELPPTHRFLGPLLWSPPDSQALPEIRSNKPVLFVSLGSSNDVPCCREIIEELATLDVELLVATAGRFSLPPGPRLHIAPFLPGMEAAQRASLVIGSGGSTAAYQALSVGTPVLGLPSNTDQLLAMGAIERAGAGSAVRADQATPQNVRALVERMLADGSFKQRAMALSRTFANYDALQRFRAFVGEVLPPARPEATRVDALQTLPERLRRRARQSPDQPAFWALDERKAQLPALSYGQVWDRVQHLAAAFRARGLKAGDRVGFLAGVSPAWEQLQLAVMWAGGVVVGLDLHDDPQRVLSVAQQCDIQAWVVEDARIFAERSALFAQESRFVVLVAGATPDPMRAIGFASLLQERSAPLLAPPDPGGLATIIFTSGTTAEPKGVAYTHRQLTHAIRAINRAYRSLPDGTEMLCWLPLSNLFQRMVNLCAMDRGGLITFVSHPNHLMEALPLVRPEILIGVPRFYEKWEAGVRKVVASKPRAQQTLFWLSVALGQRYRTWAHQGKAWRVLAWPLFQLAERLVLKPVRQQWGGRLKYLVSGSAAMPRKTMDFFWGLGFLTLEAYGTSENPVPVAMNRPEAFSLGTTGKPLAPNDVRLGDQREVLVKGPSLFTGYWKHAGEPPQFEGAYYKTGDEGRFERGGFLSLLGRHSEFIKTSTGRRIAPAPIEQSFQALNFVDQAVLLGNGRKGVVLLVTVNADVFAQQKAMASLALLSATKEQMSQALRAHVARMPSLSQPLGVLVLSRSFSVLNGEMTANLKLRRRVIEDKFADRLDELFDSAVHGPGQELPVWFLSSADVRMQHFSNTPSLKGLRTYAPARWASLAGFLGQAVWAYGQYVRDLVREPWEYKALRARLVEILFAKLRTTVGPLKGPLVKIGQTLSYLDLGLSPTAQASLKEFQDRLPPLSSQQIRAVVRKSLGRDPQDIFDDWQDLPLAAASISQIHLARLKDGTRVAVKVRYPGIERIVKTDLLAIQGLLPLIASLTGIRNVKANFQEAKKLLLGECDLRQEADFMRRFKRIFADDARIIVPEVYPEYSCESVLTMEYVEGQSYAEFKATATADEIDQAGDCIYKFFAVAAFGHGLFHADPHPGNYLFQHGKLCFLDFGCCKEWSREFIDTWKRQTRAVLANDLAAFTEATQKLGTYSLDPEFNYASLLACYRNSVEQMILEDRPFHFTPEFVREMSQSLIKHQLGVKHAVSPPEVLAFSRLFWGQQAVLADLGASINCYRHTMPLLHEDVAP